jgi:hypothetical protein
MPGLSRLVPAIPIIVALSFNLEVGRTSPETLKDRDRRDKPSDSNVTPYADDTRHPAG